MLRSALVAAALAAATIACRPAPTATPADLEARLARIEARLDRLTGVTPDGATGGGDSDMPATADIRLLRLEQRLEKIIAFLRQAVPASLDENQVYAIPVDPLDPVIGPADAAVTLIEAYEYLCPYCAMVDPKLDELRRRFPRELRTVAKYYVIHGEPATHAGKAACAAARQGKFAAVDDALWKSIWPEPIQAPDKDQTTVTAVAATAKAAGLDMKRYAADVAGPCAAWLDASARTLQQFGAAGTPSFWLNGRPLDATSVDEMANAITAELARVKASGVAPASYYQDVVLAKGADRAIMTSPFD